MKTRQTPSNRLGTLAALVPAIILTAVLGFAGHAQAQNSWYWKGYNNGYWTSNNWDFVNNNGGGGPYNQQGYVNFPSGVSAYLNNTNDNTAGSGGFQIYFNSGANSFTVWGNNSMIMYDYNGVAPKVENDSANLQTINFPIEGQPGSANPYFSAEPASGDLTFNSTIKLNTYNGVGNQLRVTSGNSHKLTLNGVVSDGGGGLATTFALNGNSTVVLGATNTFTGDTFANAGTLVLATNTALRSAFIRLGDTTGTAPAFLNLNSGNNATNAINVRSGSSGVKMLANTSGTAGAALYQGNLFMDADATLFANSGGGNVLSGTTLDLQGQTLTMGGPGTNLISGALINSTGSGILAKSDSGILTLSGANTYTGETDINGGELWLTTGGSLTTSTIYVGNGGLLSTTAKLWLVDAGHALSRNITVNPGNTGTRVIGGLNTSGTVTYSGTVALNGPVSLEAASGGTVTFSNVISGSSNVTADAVSPGNAGTVILSGTNTYGGNTTISAGTLTIGGAGQLGSGTYAGNITNNGSFFYNSSASNILSGAISGSGTLTKAGTGTLTLSGANTYSGYTLVYNSIVSTNIGPPDNNGALVLNNTITSTDIRIGNYSSNSSTAYNHVLALGVDNALPATANILFDGKAGASYCYLKLMGRNLTVAGINQLDTSAGNSSAVIENSGNENPGPTATSTLTVSNTTDQAFGGRIRDQASNTSGGLALVKDGSAKLTLTNGLSYSKGTTVKNGTLDISGSTGFSASGAITNSGGTLAIGSITSLSALSYLQLTGGGTISGSGTITSTSAYDLQSGTVNPPLAGSSVAVNKTTAGTVTLAGVNTYSGGTTISGGTLALSGTASIANTPSIVVASNAIFDVSGLSSPFALGSSQKLTNSTPGALINGTNNCSVGTVSLVYDGVNPSFTVTNGGMTLSASTTLKVNKTGTQLAPGIYKIIAKATAGNVGLVAGAVPAVTVNNGASSATLGISGGELYLTNGGTSTITYTGTSFGYNGSAQGPGISFSGSTGAKTTNYVGTGATTYSSVSAPTNAGTYYVSNTVAADANYMGATNSQAFAITILTWDAGNTGNGATVDPASGTWDTTTPNWNNGSGNVAWTQTSTTSPLNDANFGGADGTYTVTLSGQLAATSLIFNNSGYTLTNGTLYNSSGNVTVASGKTATIGSEVTGTPGLIKLGAGTLTLSSSNSYSGGATLSTGTLNVNNTNALGSGTFTNNGGTIDNTSGGTISCANAVMVNADINFTGTGSLTLGAPTFAGGTRTIAVNNNTLTLGAINQTSGGLIKAGNGTVVTTTGSANTGGWTLNAGTLQIGAGNHLSALGAPAQCLTFGGNGTLALSFSGAVLAGRTFAINSGVFATNDTTLATGTVIYSNNMVGPGHLVKAGTGVLRLDAPTNTYSGDTYINAGTLSLDNATAITNTPNVFIAAGATLYNTLGGYTFGQAGKNQTLKIGGATTASTNDNTITVNSGSGLIFNAYNGSTIPLRQASGTMNLVAGNTVIVTNTGALLDVGNYVLVGGGTGNTTPVTGTAPSTVNVYNTSGGSGLASGTATASLIINGSGQLQLTVSDPPTKLAMTTVPTTAADCTAFAITVQAQNSAGTARNVTANTAIQLALTSGTGALSGNTATITAGTSSVTLSGVSYNKAETITLKATRTSGDSLTDSATSNVVVSVGSQATTTVETAANGSGATLGITSLPSGTPLTVYAISRDGCGNFIGNVVATWSLQNITGNVVSGDLVAAGDNKSATFTAAKFGSAKIQAVTNGITGQSGTITVTAPLTAADSAGNNVNMVNGSNSGTNFGAWASSSFGGGGGQFIGSSLANTANHLSPGIDVSSKSWGMYASGATVGANYARIARPFTNGASLQIGQTFAADMQNGLVTSGSVVGFILQNASGADLFKFSFAGGDSFYKINNSLTTIPYVKNGLRIMVTLTGATTYTAVVYTNNTLAGTAFTNSGTLLASGPIMWAYFMNEAAGSGPDYDLFFNSIGVNNPTLTLPASLPAGTYYTAYGQSVAASGGSGTYTYAVTSGSLPAWATLNTTTGAITGTPLAFGTSTFTITATDVYGYTGSQAYTLTVSQPPIVSNLIEVYGSSVAKGYNAGGSYTNGSYAYGYAGLLTSYLGANGWVVTNNSTGGDTTALGLARFPTNVVLVAPKYIMLAFGLNNEGLASTSDPAGTTATFLTNLTSLISECRSNGYYPVLGSCYPNNAYTNTTYAYIKSANLTINSWNVPSYNLLGALDDGLGDGNYVANYWSDATHPNAAGHQEYFYTLVPTLFNALAAGITNSPQLAAITNFARLTQDGSVTAPITFTPTNTVHSFTVSFRVRSTNSGTIAAIHTGSGYATLQITNGQIVYVSTNGSQIVSSITATNGDWHDVALAYRYALTNTWLFVDGVQAGVLTEQYVPDQFTLGGPSASGRPATPAVVDFQNWCVYRSAWNLNEAQAQMQGSRQQASMEICAALEDASFASNSPATNRAQSLSVAMVNTTHFTAKQSVTPPSSLTAQPLSGTAVKLTWTKNSTTESGFELERRVTGTTNWSDVALLAAGSTAYTNSGLTAGVSYDYRVAAVEGGLRGNYSNTATVVPGMGVHQTILVDFGPNDGTNGNITTSPDWLGQYWNNLVGIPSGSANLLGLANLITTTNGSTTIGLTNDNSGWSCNGILNGGLLAPSYSLLGNFAVTNATEDYFFTGGSSIIAITNLDSTLNYRLRLFGTRDSTETRVTRFIITGGNGSFTNDLTTSGVGIASGGGNYNNSTIASITGVKPNGNNQIIVGVNKLTGTYAHLGIMELMANHSPVAQALSTNVTFGQTISVDVIDGANAPTDADGDGMTISAVSGSLTGSGTMATNGGTGFTYTATAAGTCTFSYTVTDTYGGIGTNVVTVTIAKQTPVNQTLPTAGSICLGSSLSGSTVTGAAFTNASGGVITMAATNFVSPALVPSGTPSPTNVLVYFTPGDLTDYNYVTNTVSVTVNALPTPSAGNNGPVCEGTPLSLTSSGGVGYTWSGPNGFSSTAQNPTVNASATLAMAGTYTVIVTNASDCTASTTTAVTVNALPTTSGITGTNLVTHGTTNTYSVTATSGSSYGWSVPANATFSGGMGNSISVIFSTNSGSVSVIETNNSGCTGTPQSLSVTVTNHAPVAVVMNVLRTPGEVVFIALTDLATNWSDADGDAVRMTTFNGVTTNGVNLTPLYLTTTNDWSVTSYLTADGGFLGYTNTQPPLTNLNDQFTYSVSDGFGGTNIGYVNIVVDPFVAGTQTITGQQTTNSITNATFTVTYYGIPGYTYLLERSTNLTAWVDISTNTIGSGGVTNVVDDFGDLGFVHPSSAYYRVGWKPSY